MKGPRTGTTIRAWATVKILWKELLGLNRPHRLLLLLPGHSTHIGPSVAQVLSLGPPYGQKALKALLPFVFTLSSAPCNYQNKGSFLTLGDQHKPSTANCIFQVWMNDNKIIPSALAKAVTLMVRQWDKKDWFAGIYSLGRLQNSHSLVGDKLGPDAINKYYSIPVQRGRGHCVLMNEPVC